MMASVALAADCRQSVTRRVSSALPSTRDARSLPPSSGAVESCGIRRPLVPARLIFLGVGPFDRVAGVPVRIREQRSGSCERALSVSSTKRSRRGLPRRDPRRRRRGTWAEGNHNGGLAGNKLDHPLHVGTQDGRPTCDSQPFDCSPLRPLTWTDVTRDREGTY